MMKLRFFKQGILCLLLAVWLCLPAAASENTCWQESFAYNSAQEMLDTGMWELEKNDLPMGISGQMPVLSDGQLILSCRESVALCWPALPDMKDFDANALYTLSFDVQLQQWEGDSGWTKSRELYVGPGGWYNLLELQNGKVSVANSGTWTTFDPTIPLRVQIFWQGDTISVTVDHVDGSPVIAGSRSRAEFLDMSALSNTMERWVFRCEDGEIALSNLSFSVETPVYRQERFPLDGNTRCSAILTVADGGTASLSFDGGQLLRFHRGTLTIGGTVAGLFPAGDYLVELDLNLAQSNALVTLTLPDGRVVRRGDSQLLGNAQQVSELIFSGTEGCALSQLETASARTVPRDYTLPQPPAQKAFDLLAWNLISSFDGDGKTTRSFAWTAHTSMNQMAVRYAPAGQFSSQGSRITVPAVEEVPVEAANQGVLYYKADLTGLRAGTSYTYQIGDMASDLWSEPYSFTTEAEDTDAFSFLVLSDTQSLNWDGYRYSAAALEYGLELAPDARFLLHGGDVVVQGSQEPQWTQFFRSVKGTAERLPLFAAIGNHDSWSTTSDKSLGDLLFDLHFNHPNNGGILSDTGSFSGTAMKNLVENIEETFYSFDYGNLHVVVLNSGTFVKSEEDNRLLEAQRAWLAADLAASDAQWTVALVHQGVYHRYNTSWNCNALQDLLEDAGVDLVLQGHEHLVKRTYPLRDGKVVVTPDPDVIPKGTGTVYFTMGSTTTSHDHLADTIEECLLVNGLEAGQATCTVVRVSPASLSVETRTLNGLTVDSFTIYDRTANMLEVQMDGCKPSLSALLSGSEAQLQLQTGKTANCSVYAACYGQDGRMISCIPVFSGKLTGGTLYSRDFSLPRQIEAVTSVQFFLLEKNHFRPLCKPWTPSEY